MLVKRTPFLLQAINIPCGRKPRFAVEFDMLQGLQCILLTFFLGQREVFLFVYVFTLRLVDWKFESMSSPNTPPYPCVNLIQSALGQKDYCLVVRIIFPSLFLSLQMY